MKKVCLLLALIGISSCCIFKPCSENSTTTNTSNTTTTSTSTSSSSSSSGTTLQNDDTISWSTTPTASSSQIRVKSESLSIDYETNFLNFFRVLGRGIDQNVNGVISTKPYYENGKYIIVNVVAKNDEAIISGVYNINPTYDEFGGPLPYKWETITKSTSNWISLEHVARNAIRSGKISYN